MYPAIKPFYNVKHIRGEAHSSGEARFSLTTESEWRIRGIVQGGLKKEKKLNKMTPLIVIPKKAQQSLFQFCVLVAVGPLSEQQSEI